MTALADYVGAEPDGLRALAGAIDAAEMEVGFAAARIQALLDAADVVTNTAGTLRNIVGDMTLASEDIRSRAAVADDWQRAAAAPVCIVPWWDPARRAWNAIVNNAWNFGRGTVDSFTGAGSTIWRLTPANPDWRQEWSDLGDGVEWMMDNPGQAVDATLGEKELVEEGYSYWAGGIVPDLAMMLMGVGAAKRSVSVVDTVDDVADAAEDLRTLDRLADAAATKTRRSVVEGDGVHPSLLRRMPINPEVERVAKADVLKIDAETGGHHASRHGADTTLEQQRRRALEGVLPDGSASYRVNASRFFRWEDQRAAIERAKELWDGEADEVRVPFDHLVGEGYTVKGDYRQSSAVMVRFGDRGPYSSFPLLEEDLKQLYAPVLNGQIALEWLFNDEALDYIFNNLDMQNEAAVRHVLRHTTVPVFKASGPKRREHVKKILQWALSYGSDQQLVSLDAQPGKFIGYTNPPRLLFEWWWSELFGDEDWRTESLRDAELVWEDPPRDVADEFGWLQTVDPAVLRFPRSDGLEPGHGAPADPNRAKPPRLRPRDASRFLRWEDQLAAIQHAQKVHEASGQHKVWVEFEHIMGEGYLIGGEEYRETNWAVVRFRDGQPVASWPDLRKGWKPE